jgi:Tfp pilus assembly protein PilN
MIRANLLPRRRSSFAAFGLEIDFESARQALAGIALVAVVAGVGNGIEHARIANLQAEVAEQEAAVTARAPAREEARRLALDVARYEEFTREAAIHRRSGAAAAVAVARIGNALPASLWLDTIDRDAAGYGLAGGARTVDAVGRAMLSLEALAPGEHTELVALDAHPADRSPGLHFSAHVGAPATAQSER